MPLANRISVEAATARSDADETVSQESQLYFDPWALQRNLASASF
jgi:hypothetical protein